MGVLLPLLWLLLALLGGVEGNDIDKVIADLNLSIATSQSTISGQHGMWVYQRGVYPSYIRNNLNGGPESEILRDKIAIPDNNAFVTLWVSIILLEAARVKNAPAPTDQQLHLALEALHSYHDNNSPAGDGTMVFWPQSYNSSSKLWYASPVNIARLGHDAEDMFNFVHKVLDDLHLEAVWKKIFEEEDTMISDMIDAHYIPPDFDDNSVNIGLGSLLSSYERTKIPFQIWKGNNTNFTQVFRALKKYAYRPFTSGETAIIDPRTYFYLRDYLHAVEKEQYPVAFVPTWAHTITEDNKTHFSCAMPFHVNNVDLTVGANVIYSITATYLTELADTKEWFDEDVQMIYENTTNLLAWAVHHNFSGRPDFALTYYPSIYNFYWFTSRSLNLLQAYSSNGRSLPHPVLASVMATLSAALRGNVTADLLRRANTDKEGLIYFEDFLGNADKNILGEPVKHGEDRVCSTAMAINTLLYTWMDGEVFISSVPEAVKEVVRNASLWLARNIKKMKPYNVVFSGSVKLVEDLPFFYPANVMMFLNGSAVPKDAMPSPDMVYAVRALIPEEEYAADLKKKHFGQTTPIDFVGYNSGSFPFWSSEPFTYASAMLSLAQYRALVASGQLPDSQY